MHPNDGQSASGEIVIWSGPKRGTSYRVNAPVTLFGRAEFCDLRLDEVDIGTVHCALIQAAAGWLVCDLRGGRTAVNGEVVLVRAVRDGDVLEVGSLQFLVRLPEVLAAPGSSQTPDCEALQIQAAAVAAQQAALTEAEIQLEQRQQALTQQEVQLATRLAERQDQLERFQQQLREQRARLHREQTALAQRALETECRQEELRRQLLRRCRQTEAERRRLVELRCRLKRRWHRHWAAERVALTRREAELQAARRELEEVRAVLDRERRELRQAWLRLNGEAEQSRRDLQDAWDSLLLEQRQWQAQHRQAEAALRQQNAELSRRAELIAAEEAAARKRCLDLHRELSALENRVVSHRRLLLEGRSVPQAVPATVSELAVRSTPSEALEAANWLKLATEELDDQRLCLTERRQQLVRAEHRWRDESRRLLDELETAVLELQGREEALAAAEDNLRRRAADLLSLQHRLEVEQARLQTAAAQWQAERDRLLAQVEARERHLEEQQASLHDLRQQWRVRSQKELNQLRVERAACEQLRRQWAARQRDAVRRQVALARSQRAVAERALALERYRQEVLGQAADPHAAERQIRRLRRAVAVVSGKEARALASERDRILREAARLESLHDQLERISNDLSTREAGLNCRLTEWEEQRAQVMEEFSRLRQESASMLAERVYAERQVETLRREVEHLAFFLLADDDKSLPVAA